MRVKHRPESRLDTMLTVCLIADSNLSLSTSDRVRLSWGIQVWILIGAMSVVACLISLWDWRHWREAPLVWRMCWWKDLACSAAVNTVWLSSIPLFLEEVDPADGVTTLTDRCTSSKTHLPHALWSHSSRSSSDGWGEGLNILWVRYCTTHSSKDMHEDEHDAISADYQLHCAGKKN